MVSADDEARLPLFESVPDVQPATAPASESVVVLPTGPVIASDGLAARLIKLHTLDKFHVHAMFCAIFNKGMKNLWVGNRGYLELFASTGLAVVDGDGTEVDGCPLIAAAAGFDRLAFVEFNPVLADALERRLLLRGIGPDRARVFQGDANDRDVLAAALEFLPNPGLNFAFIDPEDINGEWDAIRFIASHRSQRMDFLVNVPIGAMKRNVDRSAKAITAVLGTDEWEPRVRAGEPVGLVFRETLARQFRRLGFDNAEHMEIRGHVNQTPIYDLVFASRDPRGIDFWQKIQKIDPNEQRRLF